MSGSWIPASGRSGLAVVGGAIAGVVDPDVVLGGRGHGEDDGLDGRRCRPVSWIPASGRSGSGSAERARGVERRHRGHRRGWRIWRRDGAGGVVEASVERRA
ncbi:hypothetical protein OsI_07590 [Oryza sativa Indica Group]|uniref:Uncharacterized protein n=1 Tax=Oryza sativa subsp. indica TaxID=39946 RepID=B8AJC4_ORYSI|nr:hypothetical protein OsI_07590 [Oryza sativa Indica Group]